MPPDDDKEWRDLLVVAFHYPPDNTSTGVLRTAKFTEYLLRHKWHSRVVTVPERLYASRNPTETCDVPDGISVERPWACDIKELVGIRGAYPGWLAVPDRYWPWLFTGYLAGARAVRRYRVDALYSTAPVPTAHLIGLLLKKRFGLPWVADFRDPWVEDSMPRLRRWCEGKMERRVIESADRVICNTPTMRRAFTAAYPSIPATKFSTITNGYD
ncbi:MAG: glycosyltransferase, partial [bacterium]